MRNVGAISAAGCRAQPAAFLGVTLAFVLFSGSAAGADNQGRFAIKGAGQGTCGRFATAVNENAPELRLFVGWINGYLTASNVFTEQTYDLAGFRSDQVVASLLHAHCARNPEQRFQQAVAGLASALHANRIQQYEGVVNVEDDAGNAGVLYVQVVRELERRLGEAGFEPGNQDGEIDEKLRRAIRSYQEANSLEVTGAPDMPTLMLLFSQGDGAGH